MNERDFARALQATCNGLAEFEECVADFTERPAVREVRTFEEVMMLTKNAGLVVRLDNGDEFQITIVQSAHGDCSADDEDEEDAQYPPCDACDGEVFENGRCATCGRRADGGEEVAR